MCLCLIDLCFEPNCICNVAIITSLILRNNEAKYTQRLNLITSQLAG